MAYTFGSPAAEPVAADLVKEYLRVDSSDTSQDNVITLLITAARQAVEDHLRRVLVQTTVTWNMEAWETKSPIWLPYPPVASITSLTVYDADGNGTVVDSGNYELVEGLKLVARSDGWSISRAERAATLVYVAGYGANATDVPSAIREAILRTIGNHFEERQGFVVGAGAVRIPPDALDLLERYRHEFL